MKSATIVKVYWKRKSESEWKEAPEMNEEDWFLSEKKDV